MSSAAQQTANQSNAQKSTGPITEQGKATSSRNNLRHGFRSQTVLLPGDDPAAYQALLADLSEYYSPGDLTELRFVREMADADWRLRRVREHQESAITRHMAKIAFAHPDLEAMELQSIAIETLSETGTSYGTWLRYETKFERQYDRAFKAWAKYQELRRNAAIEEADLAMNKALSATPPESPDVSASNVQTLRPPNRLRTCQTFKPPQPPRHLPPNRLRTCKSSAMLPAHSEPKGSTYPTSRTARNEACGQVVPVRNTSAVAVASPPDRPHTFF
jgi:hypothetical protein